MNKIGIIYTTFLRNNLAYRTINSVQSMLNENCILFIGDQNLPDKRLIPNKDWRYTIYQPLPYDCGLSAARNYLVALADLHKCNLCLLTADSIEFTEDYDLQSIIEFLFTEEKITRIGFNLINRFPWDFDMELVPGRYFLLNLPKETVIFDNIEFTKVDICKNFFLAKTKSLLNVQWDNELKLGEHEDFNYRYKEAGYKTYYTAFISANYIDEKPIEYKIMRDRMYTEFRQKLQQKYNISEWVKYGKGVKFKKCI